MVDPTDERVAARGQRGALVAAAGASRNSAELAALATNPLWRVRTACATNPDTDLTTLRVLTMDAHHRVRLALVRRVDVPLDIVSALLDDAHGRVRSAAMTNASVGLDALADRALRAGSRSVAYQAELVRRLGEGADPTPLLTCNEPIVAIAAQHGDLSFGQRWRLAGGEPSVRRALAQNPRLGIVAWRVSVSRVPLVRAIYASSPSANPWVLATMHVLGGARVKRAVAQNPRTGQAVLLRLSDDPRWDVRCRVAANSRTPAIARRWLSRDPTWAVRAALLANEATPDRRVRKMLPRATGPERLAALTNPALRPYAVDWLASRAEPIVRGYALGHPNIPLEMLDAAAADLEREPWVLRRIASNPRLDRATAEGILTWLAIGAATGGDPTFDPVTGRGHPGDMAVSARESYLRLAGMGPGDATDHPLWPVRAAVLDVPVRHPASVADALARDPVVNVRRRAAHGTISIGMLRELQDDEDVVVQRTATNRYGRLTKAERQNVQVRWHRPARPTSFAAAMAVGLGMIAATTLTLHPDQAATVVSRPSPTTIDLSHVAALATFTTVVVTPGRSATIEPNAAGVYPSAQLGTVQVIATAMAGPNGATRLFLLCFAPSAPVVDVTWATSGARATTTQLTCVNGSAAASTFDLPPSDSVVIVSAHAAEGEYTLDIVVPRPNGIR